MNKNNREKERERETEKKSCVSKLSTAFEHEISINVLFFLSRFGIIIILIQKRITFYNVAAEEEILKHSNNNVNKEQKQRNQNE